MISAVILTKNEKNNIRNSLTSLSWCQELIVVDDFSTDGTEKIAKENGATVIQRKLADDWSAQRNHALHKAKGDWILFLDADEVISPELASEIEAKIKFTNSEAAGFFIPRRDFFLGRWLKHGETGKIKLLRLARNNAGEWIRPVHETWKVRGEISYLKHAIFHYSHRSISEFVSGINKHSEIDARVLPEEGKDFNYFRTIANPLGKFVTNYFLKLGFLDGMPGFVMAYMMSLQSLITRIKLYENSQKKQ